MPDPCENKLYGFPRTAVLRQSGDFSLVFNKTHAKSWSKAGLVLAHKSSVSGQSRLGLVVGKKSLKRASDRNTVKRLMRESFRHKRPNLPAADYVFIASKALGKDMPLNRSFLRSQMDRLWYHIERQLKASTAKQ